jgi:hypothetical protein
LIAHRLQTPGGAAVIRWEDVNRVICGILCKTPSGGETLEEWRPPVESGGISNRKGEVGMLRYGLVALVIGSLLFQSGCAEQKPKPGGVTTVSPPIAPKAGSEAKPDAGKKGETPDSGDSKPTEPTEDGDKKPTPPGDAGSTTGGGTETPGEDK